MPKIRFRPKTLIRLEEICVISSKRFWVHNFIFEMRKILKISLILQRSYFFFRVWRSYLNMVSTIICE